MQLGFAFNHEESYSSDEFIISSSNEEAYLRVLSWPSWGWPYIAIYGSEGSGKTHLAYIWKEKTGAAYIQDNTFAALSCTQIFSYSRYICLDLSAKPHDEEKLFHLMNMVKDEGGNILFTSETPPARWNVKLPDLASRLRAIPSCEIHEPDEMLTQAIISKSLYKRGIIPRNQVVMYIADRIPRSFREIEEFIEKLDNKSLVEKKPVSIAMVKEII